MGGGLDLSFQQSRGSTYVNPLYFEGIDNHQLARLLPPVVSIIGCIAPGTQQQSLHRTPVRTFPLQQNWIGRGFLKLSRGLAWSGRCYLKIVQRSFRLPRSLSARSEEHTSELQS